MRDAGELGGGDGRGGEKEENQGGGVTKKHGSCSGQYYHYLVRTRIPA